MKSIAPINLWAALMAGLLAVALVASAEAQSVETPAAQPAAGWWLAERDTAGQMRITFDTASPDPSSPLRAEGAITTAQFAALEATAVPPSRRRAPSAVKIGDPYDLVWNGQAVQVRIVALFALRSMYDLNIGAEVASDAAGEAKLSAAGGKYFLARQAGANLAPATGSPPPAALFPAELPGSLQAQIGAMLTPRALKAANDMLQKSGDPQNPYESWLHRFLTSSPGAPRLDIQGVRLAGSMGERYLVRAEWSSNGAQTFVLGAWVALAPALTLLSVDMTAPETVQNDMDCCGSSAMAMDDDYPRLLRVVDLGGQRTGVLRERVVYEGNGIELDTYSDAAGLAPTGLFVPFI